VSVASSIEREWIEPTACEIVHRFDEASGSVRAVEERRLGALLLSEAPVAPDEVVTARLLGEALLARGLGDENEATLRRLRFARLPHDIDAMLRDACAGQARLPRIDLAALLPHAVRRELDRLAPVTIEVPSGRRLPLHYRAEGDVALEVKLQELFGLADSPKLGPDRAPVLLILLSPGRRPVQQTRDLRSFWERTYPEIRKELRGRYPRHPWPDDPWSAPPTHRTERKK
jgi:ATP-dependent helicase HrpB